MKILNFMRNGLLNRKKSDDKVMPIIPVEVESIPSSHVGHELTGGNGGNGGLVDGRLITIREPYSMIAEQYRVLSTRISKLVQNKSSYTLAITSSLKSEGKSFTALNLAITLAKDFDENVLLIEGDLKNPTLHEYLKRSPGFGLSDVIEGRIDMDTAAIKLFEGKLTVLLAGKKIGNPSRLISSPKMEEILNNAKGVYKYIIIDAPPVLPLVDMNIYSNLVDGILLIIRAGKTPKSMVKRALSSMHSEKVIGAVLNDVEMNYSKYYYGSKYAY